MIGLNVWARGNARVFCALIGMVAGYLGAMIAGVLPPAALLELSDLPLLALPSLAHLHWTVSGEMALPFIIAAVAATLKTVGIITVCQRINDDGWVRPDMASLSRGVLADGLGTAIGGLLGSVGLNTSTPCTGLAAATGVTSRVIGFAAGVILVSLGFLPKVTGLFVLMPRPVMGAALVFSACFILISGMQTIASRMLDARRTLVIGIALSAGLAVEISPNLAAGVPLALQPIVGSALVFGTIVALALNLLFRLGQRQYARLVIDAQTSDPLTIIKEFFDAQGRAWGARRDVMERVSFGVSQAVEAIQELWEPGSAVDIDAHFDEFNLDVTFTYRGVLIEIPERRPTDQEVLETETGYRRLAGFMLRRNADHIAALSNGEENTLQFHFDH
jgi:NCS2 family nucleobase:cation symporter-2